MAIRHRIFMTDNLGRGPDIDYCREEVYRGWSWRQCTRKPTVFENVEIDGEIDRLGFCTQHSLEYKQKKDDARKASDQAKRADLKRASGIRGIESSIVKTVLEMHGLPPSRRWMAVHQLMNMADRLKKLKGRK